MKSQNKILSGLGLVLFLASALLGMVFFASLTWANLEANFYFGLSRGAETKLRLICPRILTPQDSGAVTAIVANKTEKTIEPIYEVEFSGPLLRTVNTQPSIGPGKTQELKWPVSTEDVDFGHLIMAQVHQSSAYKTPTAAANCGTLYLSIPALTGMQVYILVLVLSLLGIAVGIILWAIGNRPLAGRTLEWLWGMLLLTAIVILGIVFGSLGRWLFGTFTLALALLMFIVQIIRRLMPS